jgi:hypothetical protein
MVYLMYAAMASAMVGIICHSVDGLLAGSFVQLLLHSTLTSGCLSIPIVPPSLPFKVIL